MSSTDSESEMTYTYLEVVYTVFHEKGTTLFSTITLAFLVDFYNFYTIGNRNKYFIITYNLLT